LLDYLKKTHDWNVLNLKKKRDRDIEEFRRKSLPKKHFHWDRSMFEQFKKFKVPHSD